MNFWNFEIWDVLVQFGVICLFILGANILRRKVPFLRKSLLPTALIGGILALITKIILDEVFDIEFFNIAMLDGITYHAVALGFIALGLRQNYNKRKETDAKHNGISAGAQIAGTLVLQGTVGLFLTLIMSLLIFPDLFGAGGILMSVGFGQGPGQSNNMGSMFESNGFAGGQSFAITICSIGILIGSVVSVIYINILRKRGKLKIFGVDGDNKVTEEQGQPDEMPLTEPVDRLTMNIVAIMTVFMVMFGIMFGLKELLLAFGVGDDILAVVFGFNFIFGTLLAMAYKKVFAGLKKKGWVKHEYTSNTSLNRIGGAIFDVMIISSVILIDIEVLGSLIAPLLILCAVVATVTFFYLRFVSRKLSKGYEDADFLGMFANLTGTISTGMSMIRLVDPNFETPASDNLVVGSSFAVVLGFPMMFLLPLSITQPWLTLGILAVLFCAINLLVFKNYIFKKKKPQTE